MKFKPTNKAGGMVVELGPKDGPLPGLAPAALPAFKLKKILVPVDFSDCAKKALQYAIPFAKQFGAKLVLLHVVEPYPLAPELAIADAGMFRDQMSEPIEEQFEALQGTIGKEVSSQKVVRTGQPHAEITAAAKELGSDLIIISTHGHTGLAHVFLGSTAEKVIRHAPCPVLVVREREREFVVNEPDRPSADD